MCKRNNYHQRLVLLPLLDRKIVALFYQAKIAFCGVISRKIPWDEVLWLRKIVNETIPCAEQETQGGAEHPATSIYSRSSQKNCVWFIAWVESFVSGDWRLSFGIKIWLLQQKIMTSIQDHGYFGHSEIINDNEYQIHYTMLPFKRSRHQQVIMTIIKLTFLSTYLSALTHLILRTNLWRRDLYYPHFAAERLRHREGKQLS